jgi:hypothetical protein
MEQIVLPLRSDAERQALASTLHIHGYARVFLSAIPAILAECMAEAHGEPQSLALYPGRWFSAEPTYSGGQLELASAPNPGGSYHVLSGAKEYTHLTDGTVPELAKPGFAFMEQVAIDALATTGVASHLTPPEPASRRRTVEQRLVSGASKLQAYRYFGDEELGPTEAILGCPEHVDSGVLTLVLHYGVAGLEVVDQLDGKYLNVETKYDNTETATGALAEGFMSATLLVGHTLQVRVRVRVRARARVRRSSG